MKQSKSAVPRDVMVNQRHEPLFDFIAARIALFLKENPEMDVDCGDLYGQAAPVDNFRKLGFTFSFTYDSHSASNGTMLQWDKGWDIPDAIGRDPAVMLQDAIDRLKLRVQVTALTNDSVGTLMAKAYTSSESCTPLIGAIFGTGTNAAYVEELANIKKLPPSDKPCTATDTIMVINTEWGAWFDKSPSALPACTYDEILDKQSSSPGEQLFEKETSALYVGELARLAIYDLVASKNLDMTINSGSPLEKPYSLSSSFLSTLAAGYDETKDTSWEKLQRDITENLQVTNLSVSDVLILSRLGAAIVRRAAQLAGATIAAIIIHSGRLSNDTRQQSASTAPKRGWWCFLEPLANALCNFWKTTPSDEDAATFDSESTLNSDDDCIDIGIDGSLFEHYPRFEQDIRSALRVVPRIGSEGESRVKIGLAKDGSSLGAALIAQSIP